MKWLLSLLKRKDTTETTASLAEGAEALVTLRGRSLERMVVPSVGDSILELADRNKVDWMSHCKRGTCGRCRCLVNEGMEHLAAPSKAELDRLDPGEIAQGYRLGCQAKISSVGRMTVKHAP